MGVFVCARYIQADKTVSAVPDRAGFVDYIGESRSVVQDVHMVNMFYACTCVIYTVMMFFL